MAGRAEDDHGSDCGHDSDHDAGRDTLSRRRFLGAGGSVVGAASLGLMPSCTMASTAPIDSISAGDAPQTGASDDLGEVPRRVLGKTGAKVSILGLGTASMGEGPQNVEECASVFAEAIDRGINYIDTARIYGNAETALGQVLKTRREKTFLVTKCMTDTREEAQKSFEKSLAELGVDHVDLLHLHSTGDRDLDKVLGDGGAWKYLLDMKKQGKTRFLGITGHNRPLKFLRMLETRQVDVLMCAMNFVDRHTYGFEEKVLPRARELGTGVMAMKVFGGIRGGFAFTKVRRPSQLDPIFLQIAVRYSLGLEGVTGVVVGAHSSDELQQNIRFVRNAAPLSEPELVALAKHGKTTSDTWGPRFGPVK